MNKKMDKNLFKAKLSLVFGITGFIAWFLPLLGYPISIAGLVLSSSTRKKEKNNYNRFGFIFSLITLFLTLSNSIVAVILTYRKLYG